MAKPMWMVRPEVGGRYVDWSGFGLPRYAASTG